MQRDHVIPTRRSLVVVAIVSLILAAGLVTSAPAFSLAGFTDRAASTGSIAADTLVPPTGLAAVGGSSVTLTWTPSVDTYATGYTILRGSTSGGPYGAVGAVTPGSASTTSDDPGEGTWFYVLRSVYEAWASGDSTEATATVVAPYAPCTSNAAEASGAGDGDGYQTRPARACVDDSSFARDSTSGTGGSESCGTGAIPDTRKDQHRFWGFVTGLPGTVTSIDGIRVRADVAINNTKGLTNVCAQLSWNGGSTWTTIKAVAITQAAETTYTFGGQADTWGRDWTLAELSTANFRVRLIDASTEQAKRFDLDVVGVNLTYTP